MKYIKVTHKKGKHLSDIRSMIYVVWKMLISRSAFVYVRAGKKFKVDGDIPDWQKVCGWKKTPIKKVSETLAALRYFDVEPEVCVYKRFRETPNKFFVSDLREGRSGYIDTSVFIKRKDGEWIPCMPWVEGVEAGSTLPNDVYYYLHIDTHEYVWDRLLYSIRYLVGRTIGLRYPPLRNI